MKKAAFKNAARDAVMTAVGASLFSVAVNMFCVPNSIIQGGLTGVSIMLNSIFEFIPVGTAMFIMNIPLFIIGWFKIGKSFILRTAIATFMFTAAIDIGELFIPAYEGDLLLACIFGGLFSGVGLALALLSQATTGGTEIIAMLVRMKAPSVSIGRMILIVDLIITVSSYFVYRSIEAIMYAAVLIFISTRMIDFVLGGAESNKVMFIITASPKKTAAAIMSALDRGVTVIPARGAYTNSEKSLLFCVARAPEITRIYRLLPQIDPESFCVIGNVGEVIGRGFEKNKGNT